MTDPLPIPDDVVPPLATVEQWLAMQPAGTVAPANLDELLQATSAQIRRYCGWHVSPVLTMTLTLDGSGTTSQRLPSLRVVEVLTLTNGGSDVDVAGLEWSGDGFMRMSGSRGWYGGGAHWTGKLRGVVVQLRHGFDAADTGDLTALCCQLTTRSLAAPHGYMTAETTGTTTVSYGGRNIDERPGSMSLLGYEQAGLDTYRLPGRRAA